MNEVIEACKDRLNKAMEAKEDWKEPYTELMRAVYARPVLFFALSRDGFDPETATSTPLISTKDFGGMPCLYIFSDVASAEIWMRHYHHDTDDHKYGLIGAVNKEPFDFLSVFRTAEILGAERMILDEGSSFVAIGLSAFIDANGIDRTYTSMYMTKEEADRIIENGENPGLRFTRIKAIPTMMRKP